MFRRLLAIYMTFVLVAGPSLCCCTTLYAAPSPAAHTTSPPVRPSPCCCQDQCPAKGEDSSRGTHDNGDHPRPEHPPGDHKCPCKDSGHKQTLDQPASPLTAEQVARLLTATVLFTPVALTADLVIDPDLALGGSSPPGHRLTSWRLLNAAHMLRC